MKPRTVDTLIALTALTVAAAFAVQAFVSTREAVMNLLGYSEPTKPERGGNIKVPLYTVPNGLTRATHG